MKIYFVSVSKLFPLKMSGHLNQGFNILIWRLWGFKNKYVEFLFTLVDYCKMLSSAANLVLVKLEIFL